MNPLIYIVIGVLGVTFLIVMIVCVGKKSRMNKNIKRLETKLEELKNNQIEIKLNKIELISKNNNDFVEIFELLKVRYHELSIGKIAELESEIEKIKFAMQERNYKEVKIDTKEVCFKVDKLYSQYDSLDKDIDTINKEEEEIRIKLLPIKEKFRLLKSDFDQKKEELYSCKENFERYIKKLEKDMVVIDEQLNDAHYSAARELIEKFEEEINFYTKHLFKLPKLISFSMQVLPKRLKACIDRHQELKEDGYPLFNIKMISTETQINESLKEIQQKFNKLEYEGIDVEIRNIALEIQKLDEKLENEIKSKELFDEKIDIVYHISSLVTKKFLKAKRDSQSVEGIFYLSDAKKDELMVLQNKVHALDRIKGDLDSYIHSITKQPFSTIADKMIELNEFGEEVESDLNSYLSYIESLRDDSQNAFNGVNNYSIELNKSYSLILNLNHQVLTEKYQLEVESVFKQIEDLKKQLSTKPINVEITNSKLNGLSIKADRLINELNQKRELHDLSQTIIVFTNKYRSSFSDVNDVLTRAEIHFQSGEFEFAIDQVSEVLENVHPKAYEEMIRLKGIKDE